MWSEGTVVAPLTILLRVSMTDQLSGVVQKLAY